MSGTFRPSLAGYRRFQRTAPRMHEGLEDVARSIEAKAKANAPVETGDFRDSIHLERQHGNYRTVHVVADCDAASVIERTRGNPLGRAAS